MDISKTIVFLAKISDFFEKSEYPSLNTKVTIELSDSDFLKFYDDVTKYAPKDVKIKDQFILNVGKTQYIIKKINKSSA